jgi:endonuclease/exonuclease/phosphatase (EEP) superfamily protein YafD
MMISEHLKLPIKRSWRNASTMGFAAKSQRVLGFLLGAIIVFTLAVTVIGFAGRWHWYADLFNHLRPQYVFVFILTLVMSILARRGRWVALSLVGLFLNGLVVAPHAVPSSNHRAAVAGERVLHMATINLLVSNADHESVAKMLRAKPPDLVVFQEAGKAWMETLQALKDVYPHQRLEFHQRSFFGLAILSRVPWESADLVKLGPKGDAQGLAIRFEWHGRKISLMDIHSYHPTTAEKMVDRLLMQDSMIQWSSERQHAGDAVIIAGDFNCTPWASLFRNFIRDSGLIDSSRGRVFEATRNVGYPNRLLIDHVFVSKDCYVVNREVGPDIGSDHRPVFVDLAFDQ